MQILNFWLENIVRYKTNLERSATTKVGEYTEFGYSITTIYPFDDKKHDKQRGEKYMKKL